MMFRAPGPGDIGYGPHCPQFDSDGPDDEKMTLPALLRDLNRQLAIAGTALVAKTRELVVCNSG